MALEDPEPEEEGTIPQLIKKNSQQQEEVRDPEIPDELKPKPGVDHKRQLDQQVDEEKEKKEQKLFSGIKTTMFTDPNTLEKHAIPVSMSPMPTIDRILTYTDRTGFCGILCIGMSGTGKTTLAKYLVHQLHTKNSVVCLFLVFV